MRLNLSLVSQTAMLASVLAFATLPALAQTANRDVIGDLLKRSDGNARVAQAAPTATPPAAAPPAEPRDPREGDAAYEQAQRLMKAVDAILQDTARNRGEARKLPSKDPRWTPTSSL